MELGQKIEDYSQLRLVRRVLELEDVNRDLGELCTELRAERDKAIRSNASFESETVRLRERSSALDDDNLDLKNEVMQLKREVCELKDINLDLQIKLVERTRDRDKWLDAFSALVEDRSDDGSDRSLAEDDAENKRLRERQRVLDEDNQVLQDLISRLRDENVAVWRDRNKWFDAFMALVEERVDDEWDDDEDYV